MVRSESPVAQQEEQPSPKASERKEMNPLETVSHIGSCQIQVLIKEPPPVKQEPEELQEETKEESKELDAQEASVEETKSNGIAIQVTENEIQLETTFDDDKTREVH